MRARQIGLSVIAGNLSVGGQILAADGVVGAPGWAYSAEPSTGAYRAAAGNIVFTCSGVFIAAIAGNANTGIRLRSSVALNWQPGTDPTATPDLSLVRDAANTLALKNGTNVQALRVYGTTTGPKYVTLTDDGTVGLLATNDAHPMRIGVSGVGKWAVDSGSFAWMPTADNIHDVGFSPTVNRVRSVFVGTSLVIGAAQTQGAVAQSGAEGSSWTFSGTLTGSPADFNGWTFGPTLAGAFTVTRFNYLDLRNVAGAATITDAAAMRFDAAPGTHKALAANAAVAVTITSVGPTGAQTTVQGWIKMNINGTLRYVPFW